ncbi:MAG: D-2-hydroxyacid dehydrogenase, partial [Chloroflexi bacterium]|nr:D-2-hydroxyacid dehydrogenase [Chloroflexota bacterium]
RLPEADFIVTTVPHTPETEFMWNAERFALMKRSAYFINIGRGMTCKLDDLVAALDEGLIAGAGLDVYEIEPLPEGHPLWQAENVILTPHIAVADAENIPERRFELVLENARRLVEGREFVNVVDKDKWY